MIQLTITVEGLRARIAEDRRADWVLQPGMYVPAFNGPNATGDSVAVGHSLDGDRVVIALLSVSCEFSERSLVQWQALATSGVRVVGIVVDDDADLVSFAAAHKPTFPLVSFPDKRLHWLYRTAVVPQTIVIDAGGQILHSHTGEVTAGEVLDSLRAIAQQTPPLGSSASSFPNTSREDVPWRGLRCHGVGRSLAF